MKKLIKGVEIRELKTNVDERGTLCEILRRDWDIFKDPAMAYFSVTYPGVVRAWHCHPKKKQQDCFCVLQGMAKIVIYDQRKNSPTRGMINEFFVGERNMILLRIPGECWHGFQAIGTKPVILVNFPTELYDYKDPDEERLPPDTDKIPYNWRLIPWLKHG